MFKRTTLVALVIFFTLALAWGQSVGDYRSKATGNWNALATWERYDGENWVEPTSGQGTPTSASGVITIQNGHTVTVTAAVTIDQTVVEAGGTVIHSGSDTVTLANGAGTDLQINGTWRRTATYYTIIIDAGATIDVGDGGVYEHAITGSGGSIPTASWHSNSILRIANAAQMNSAPSNLGQTFGIVEINIPNQTGNWEIDGFTNIINELRVISTGSGYIRLNSTKSISGSFIQSGGRFINSLTLSSTKFTIVGNLLISGGSFEVSNNINTVYIDEVVVNGNILLNGGTIDLNKAATNNRNAGRLFVKGNMTISSGALDRTQNLTIGSTGVYFDGTGEQTFTWSGGTINAQVLKRFFYKTSSGPIGLNEVYIGSSAQTTISGTEGSPISGYSAWPTSGNLLKSITVNNPNGVTLSRDVLVNDKLTLTNGSIQLDGNTLSYAAGATLEYNGSSEQTTSSSEFPTSNGPGNLIIDNAGGVKLHDSITLSGNLNLINGALDLNGKSLTVNGTTTVSGGSFAAGSAPTIDGYVDAGSNLQIADDGNAVSGFSASSSVVEANFPQRIKRQWSISGNSGGNEKSITFSWTVDDDNDFDWSEKIPSVFSGSTEYAGDAPGNSYDVSGATRSITIVAPISSAKADWTIGLKGGDDTLPVVLSSFTVSMSVQGFARLQWVTQSETNVLGFYVFRSQQPELEHAEMVSPLIAATNSSTMQTYMFTDSDLAGPGLYYYWLQNVDIDGSMAFFGPIIFEYGNIGDQNNPGIPLLTRIERLYPNPFNPLLNIRYSLKDAQPVQMKVYNHRGQLVHSQDLGLKSAGVYSVSWNGLDLHNRACGSGTYIIEMNLGDSRHTKKAVLLK